MSHQQHADRQAILMATRSGIERDIATIAGRWRVILRQAEKDVADNDPGSYCTSRGNTRWRVYHERDFQRRLRRLARREEPSARALMRRVRRALVQAEAQARRLRLNEPWEPDKGAMADVDALFLLLDEDVGPICNACFSHDTAVALSRT